MSENTTKEDNVIDDDVISEEVSSGGNERNMSSFWPFAITSVIVYVLLHWLLKRLFDVEFEIGIYWGLSGLVLVYYLSGIKTVDQWARKVVFLFGKPVRILEPGFNWVEPAFHSLSDDIYVVDTVRTIIVKNAQTHDNVNVGFALVVTSSIEDALKSMTSVINYDGSFESLGAAISNRVIGMTTLDSFLGERDEFLKKVLSQLQDKVSGWGGKVKGVDVRDYRINDKQVEAAIALKAKAIKEAEAELERATRQSAINQKYKEATKDMTDGAQFLMARDMFIELARSGENNMVVIPSEFLKMFGAAMSTKNALT